MTVQRDIAGVPEGDHQFAQFRHLRERSANVGSCLQQPQLPLDRLTRPPSGFRCFGGQELAASFQAFRCACGNDYVWHAGAVVSSSVPQVFNQVRTSCPVRC